MSSKPKERFPLDELARRLESAKTTGPEGKMAFDGLRYEDLKTVFLTSIEWDESLSDYQRQRIARDATFAAAKTGKITKDSLLGAVHDLEAKEFALSEKEYVVVTSLSLLPDKRLKKTKIRDVEITFHAKLPKQFDRGPLRNPLFLGDTVYFPERYVVVCVKLSAKSVHAANSEAMTALNILRSIWNYTINSKTGMILRIGGRLKSEPVNKILMGPVHTVHLPDGKLAEMMYWYNNLNEQHDPAAFGNDWNLINRNTKKLLSWYHESSYPKEITDMWIRYVSALDNADSEAAFLKLWSLLELLTGTAGDKYDETIRRVLFICRDREFNRMILEHLRDRRNALVHRDDGSQDVEQYVYQLKRYIQELLRLHLAFRKHFKSLDEFGGFLASPFAPEILSERLRIYRRALDFRQKTINPPAD